MASPDKIFDDLLVLNAQHGDKKALDILIQRWHIKVVRQIKWRVSDEDIAKDLAQDCWIVVSRRLKSLKSAESFGPWVMRIANNKAVDWVRKQKVRRSWVDETYNEINQETRPDQKESLLKSLEKALVKLSQDQMIVLKLHYLEELDLATISRILSIPRGTVKSRLFRARENLKQIINKYYEDE